MEKYILTAIILCFSLTGCFMQTQTEEIAQEVVQVQPIFQEQQIDLYIKNEFELGPYEPTEGIYLGAYMGNRDLVDPFELVMDTQMAFKVLQYSRRNSITSSDILACIANKQIPYIKFLLDPDDPAANLYYLIGDISSMYQTPIFIELYPITSDITDPRDYKEKYIEAYQLIKKYVPEAVIVWSMDSTEIQNLTMFYPGDFYVDWVGLNIYMTKYVNQELAEYNISKEIDLWYKTYQANKPLIISGLAISNFSSIDHTYTIADAKNKLTYFYNELPTQYPRIKAMLYVDVDMRQYSGYDDFRISLDSDIVQHVRSLWASDIFLHEVSANANVVNGQYIKYTLPSYLYDETYYVSDYYLEAIIDSVTLKEVNTFKDLEGNVYYPMDELCEIIDGYFQ
ncbi:MAG: hypothetical protein ATN33_03770 [Epulopiscium sp. Nele67-Bin001]|nr:MAG: hypothetical protein BEN18_01400 [Epulopiscium sp. Nuni2H_MBin001]OON94893.1 MAG: hypothetical protein ATN33_03770 [Epulopiscium sp. Nele67-Bin001]